MAAAAKNYQGFTTITAIASETIPAKRMVKWHSVEGQVALCTAIADLSCGVSVNSVASGELVEIQTSGMAMVETTAAAVAINAQVMAAASGAGRVATAAGATAQSVGVARTASGGTTAGETILIQLGTPTLNGPANS